jgi:hypothetical protein
MAIKRNNYILRSVRQWTMLVCLLLAVLLLGGMELFAQAPPKQYTIKKGRMFIELSKQLPAKELDAFIAQYDLGPLALKQFIYHNVSDSLKKAGWKIEVNSPQLVVLSKAMNAAEGMNNPAERMMLTEKPLSAAVFPVISSRITYGYNRFRNKGPFAVKDNTVSFFLRNYMQAKKVLLAGSFTNWQYGAIEMVRTDSGWVAPVKLVPGKYWYKFIVDGNWTIDNDNRNNENDGEGNTNSVYYQPNTFFKIKINGNPRRVSVAGSFNNWVPAQLFMTKTGNSWELPLYLAEGTHTYRFIIDGEWLADPANPDRFPNEFNEVNSVIRIGKPYLFSLKGYQQAKQVRLIGSFNNWRGYELIMTRTGDGWQMPYTLGPGNYEFKFLVDGREVTDSDNQFVSGGSGILYGSTLILSPNYTFRLKGFETAKKVFLAGDFNSWTPNNLLMKREGNEWVFTVHLSPGKHLYKFVVDGRWIIDPANKLWEQNEYSTGNSVLWIEK